MNLVQQVGAAIGKFVSPLKQTKVYPLSVKQFASTQLVSLPLSVFEPEQIFWMRSGILQVPPSISSDLLSVLAQITADSVFITLQSDVFRIPKCALDQPKISTDLVQIF